ncbi:MAG TPA: hypothetical protein PLU50_01580, partial [Pseudobdellovibrionaceae bacterium]|nr:hypothetical protein [Pseudobdellovibrionaceae bacterium]
DLSTSPAKIISNTSLAGDDSISQWAAGSQVAYLVASTGKSDTNGALIRKLYLFDGNQFQKLPDIIGPNFDDNPNSLVVVGDDLFFIAGAAGSNFPHVYFYRRSTGQVSQISNISNDENPRDLKWLNGSLYFKAFTNFTMEVDHYYRWNNGSLSMVSDTCPGHKSDVSNLSAFGSFICFTAKKTAGASCTNYSRLYCTSGTQTVLAGNDVSDGGSGITDPRQLTSSNGNLYMIAYNQSKSHIYKWTGTGQISQLSHVNTQTNDDQISSIAVFGNSIIFSAIPQGTNDPRLYQSSGTTVSPIPMTPPGSSAIKFESTGISTTSNYYFVGSPVGSNCNQVYRYNGSNIELMIHPFPSLCKQVNMFDQANSRLLISMSDNQGNGRLYRSTDGLNLQLVSGLNPTNEDIAEKGFQLGSNYFYVPNLTTGTSLFKIQNE